MTAVRRVGRRQFLVNLGKGAVGLAVFGVAAAACSDDDEADATTIGATATTAATTLASATSTTAATATTAADSLARLQRVDLGFVSAYIVARDDGAAVVDTGVSGSAGDIEAGLRALGLDWGAVGHVIVTHDHGDHMGSMRPVMTNAASAMAYAGADDIPSMDSPRPINAVGDGDTVFGLDIIATPGHTPGHISVLDPVARFLIAGDALNGTPDGGDVLGPNPEFTADMEAAIASAVKLGGFDYDRVVFGHGEPVDSGASAAAAELAATLKA